MMDRAFEAACRYFLATNTRLLLEDQRFRASTYER